jgi:hypothetical protein
MTKRGPCSSAKQPGRIRRRCRIVAEAVGALAPDTTPPPVEDVLPEGGIQGGANPAEVYQAFSERTRP